MTRWYVRLVLLLGLFSLGSGLEADSTYTYPELVGRMTDMERLAALPQPGEQTGLASSYDRRSRYDAASDQAAALFEESR